MPYSSGTWTAAANSWNPSVAQTAISVADWATLLADISTGLSTCILKDGSQTATALVPFAAGLSAGAAAAFNVNASGAITACLSVAGTAVATQANQETGTAVNLIVTPGRQQYHQSATKAWCTVDQAGGTAALYGGSYNVSSVSDGATGVYTINFTTAFSASTYTMVSQNIVVANRTPTITTRAVGSAVIGVVKDTDGLASDADGNAHIFMGDL